MSAHWHIGMEVVCVKWNGSRLSIRAPANANMPEIGSKYTIRKIIDCGDVIILLLNELDNSHLGFAKEPGFNTSGFRPVQKRSTDISLFRALLNPSEQDKTDLIEHDRREFAREVEEYLLAHIDGPRP